MKKFLLHSFAALSLMSILSVGNVANAQELATAEATLIESGYATGIFYAFYVGERDIDPIPVAYQKYSDNSVVLPGFANGKDLKINMGEYDEEYNCYYLDIADAEGIGANDSFTYEGYEYWPFAIYRFDQPVVISQDKMEFLFMDGTSYYDVYSDTIVLDYVSAVDEDEYMFFIDFTMPFEVEDEPTALTTVNRENKSLNYDLFGHRVAEGQHGFVIRNGQKTFCK